MNWKRGLGHGNSGPCSVIIMSETLCLAELCFRTHRAEFPADLFHSQAGCLIKGCLRLHGRRRSTMYHTWQTHFRKQLLIYTLWHIGDLAESGSVVENYYELLSVLVQLSSEFGRISISSVDVWIQELMSFGQLLFHLVLFFSVSLTCCMKTKTTNHTS